MIQRAFIHAVLGTVLVLGAQSNVRAQSCGGGQQCNNPDCGCCDCSGNCLIDSTGGCCGVSPILIDLTSQGFSLTDAAHGVNFRITPTAPLVKMAWTAAGSNNAWLVMDRDGNGKIDALSEMFGNFTPQPDPPPGQQKNGFLALAAYDKPENGGNGDGWISAADAVFSKLRVWEDINHNGISEPEELHPLEDVGIKAISLAYTPSARTDEFGNRFRYSGVLLDTKEAKVDHQIYDVFLVLGVTPPRPTTSSSAQ